MAADENDLLYVIPDQARVQMMAALALAWDGQWFLKVHDKFGWEAAAEINARVRAAFAKLEMRATLHALGKRTADNLADAVRVWQTYMYLFGGERGAFVGENAIEGDTLHVTVSRCAAWEGCRRASLEHTHQSCITCETVWQAWYAALLPSFDVSQEVVARMGYGAPCCHFRVRAVPPPA